MRKMARMRLALMVSIFVGAAACAGRPPAPSERPAEAADATTDATVDTTVDATPVEAPAEPPRSRMPRLLTQVDAAAFAHPAPDARIAYGLDPLQFGELRLPAGPGPHPVVILIHGGCWLAEYDLEHVGKLAAALTENGVATWTLEYRRVGNPGGGWPGTFRDVALGADHLRVLAGEHRLDLSRVIAVGHSAGGHLALWLAARSWLPRDSELFADEPAELCGVLALAPATDLAYLHALGVCGGVVDRLMGGSPEQFPERYAEGSPKELVPLGVPQILILGRHDPDWAPAGLRYEAAVRAAGADVRRIEAPESGHFEMIDPDSSTWPLVRAAVLELLSY